VWKRWESSLRGEKVSLMGMKELGRRIAKKNLSHACEEIAEPRGTTGSLGVRKKSPDGHMSSIIPKINRFKPLGIAHLCGSSKRALCFLRIVQLHNDDACELLEEIRLSEHP